MTALMYAAEYNPNPDVTRALIASGAQVDQRDPFGVTALMLAAKDTTNPVVITVLLGAGADRGARSHGGLTAADFAVGNASLAGSPVLAALAGDPL
jgi:ankyrin repeat protein